METIDTPRTHTNTSIFSTKAEYVAFRDGWRNLIRAGAHIPKKVTYLSGNYQDGKQLESFRMESDLDGLYHLARAAALGKLPKGFSNAKREKFGQKHVGYSWMLSTYHTEYVAKRFALITPFMTEQQFLDLRTRIVQFLSEL
jgi:hypothetical protein